MDNQTLSAPSFRSLESSRESLSHLSDAVGPSHAYWLLPLVATLSFYVYEALATQRAAGKNAVTLSMGRWSTWMPRVVHNAIYTAIFWADKGARNAVQAQSFPVGAE
jgi:hypothetical protein